jgi:hypothetical protein
MRPADPAGARKDAPAVTGLSAACFGLRRHRFVVVGADTATPAVTPLGVQPRSSVVGAPILAGRRSRAMCMAACGHPSTSHSYPIRHLLHPLVGVPPTRVSLKEPAHLPLGKHRRLVFEGYWQPVLP